MADPERQLSRNPSRWAPHCTHVYGGLMPLEGEYAPSPWDWSREQADKYAESGGADAADMKGMPIILLTTVGAKTGKLRKTPLMRVEHNGEYAVRRVAGRGPEEPGLVLQHRQESAGRAPGRVGHARLRRARGLRRREGRLVGAGGRGIPGLRRLSDEDGPANSGLCAHPCALNLQLGGTIDRCPPN